MMQRGTYEQVRFNMRPGDVIAFGGSSHFSGVIKRAIRAEVSHIGVILRDHELIDATARYGVTISQLDDRIATYPGEVWWLPLDDKRRVQGVQQQAFETFLIAQVGKKYDHAQAVGSAIDAFEQLPAGFNGLGYNPENFDRFFCSELVAAGLKAGGVIPPHVNASEVTPIDVCRWNIYAPDYTLLTGNPAKEISGYNSIEPV